MANGGDREDNRDLDERTRKMVLAEKEIEKHFNVAWSKGLNKRIGGAFRESLRDAFKLGFEAGMNVQREKQEGHN